MQRFKNHECHTITGCITKTVCVMVRYIMSFTVPPGRQEDAQKIIDDYFEELYQHGPGGMRSQCYASNKNDCDFVHIKSFRKESIANQHFRTPAFLQYVRQLASLCGDTPSFIRLLQQQTFESIY